MELEELKRIRSLSQDQQRSLYPIMPQEQYEELIRLGVCRRKIKLKKARTLYCNEENGAVLYWNHHYGNLSMCGYFIDPEHPKEIEYQQKLAEKKQI